MMFVDDGQMVLILLSVYRSNQPYHLEIRSSDLRDLESKT